MKDKGGEADFYLARMKVRDENGNEIAGKLMEFSGEEIEATTEVVGFEVRYPARRRRRYCAQQIRYGGFYWMGSGTRTRDCQFHWKPPRKPVL